MQKIYSLITTSRAKVLMGFIAAFSFLVFTGSVLAATPQVTTLPAQATETTLTLNGTYSGNTGSMQVRFEWGTTPNLGTFTNYQTFADSSHAFTASLTGLTSGTTYYFRAEGINADGPAWGGIVNKTTVAYTLPQAQTTGYSNLGSTTATAGFWYQSATTATITIEYANNNQFIGSYMSQPMTKPAGSGGNTITLSGLTPSTTYWYRAVVTNSAGTRTATTAIQFTTLAAGGTGTSGTGGNTGGTTGTGTGGTTGGSTTGGTTGSLVCGISSFFASPAQVPYGSTVNLNWTTSNCNYVTVSGSNVSGTYGANNSTTTGALYNNTIYTLTAYGANGSISSTISVYVNQNPQPLTQCTISNFYASPSQVQQGASTTLSWNTQNCTSVNVSGGSVNLQNYNANGSFMTTPGTSTTYFLTATGSNGSVQSQVFVQVTNVPIPVQTYACNDGIDNDGDGRVDGNDPGCSTWTDNSEYNGGGTTGGTTTGGTTTGGTVGTGTGAVLGISSSVTSGNGYGNSLAGLAIWGSSIVPTSLLGLLIVILIILAIILIARRLTKDEAAHGGMSHSIHH